MYGLLPLHGAAVYGYTQVVELLLEEGAKADLRSKDGWSDLHYAACHNFT